MGIFLKFINKESKTETHNVSLNVSWGDDADFTTIRKDIESLTSLVEQGLVSHLPSPTHVDVILFKDSGKYYTEERWKIPEDAIGPYDMERSVDFRRIGGGAVLIPSQEPWGFPQLFPGEYPKH